MTLKVWVTIGLAGCRREVQHGIADEEWAEMSDEDREYLAREIMFDQIEWGFEEQADE
jgi:hypothetical protein